MEINYSENENENEIKKETKSKNKRFLGKLTPKNKMEKTEDGLVKCRWCKQGVKPPRRTLCSEECVHQIKLRSSGSYLRYCVYKRDRGVCSLCQVDTKLIAKKALGMCGQEKVDYLKSYNISLKRKIKKRKNGGGLWDADHIIPVQDGGGLCGLDNIRTLCIACHKKVTFSK